MQKITRRRALQSMLTAAGGGAALLPAADWPDLLLRWIDWRRQLESLP
jgi:hypothetical protein